MFKKLLIEACKLLSIYGFKREKDFFIRETTDFYQIVHFQKLKDSSKTLVSFLVNIGVSSKPVMEYLGLNSVENLNRNQWEKRLEDITKEEFDSSFQIATDEELYFFVNTFSDKFNLHVIPLLEVVSSNSHLIEKLIANVKSSSSFNHVLIEDLMIMLLNFSPNKVDEVIPILFSKAKNNNDELFLNELLRELGRKFKF